jgi:hypothetical protein
MRTSRTNLMRALRHAGTTAAVLAAVLALAVAAGAVVDLTAVRIRIADHPAFVRAVVDFTDGTLKPQEVVATDAQPVDGTVRLAITHLRVQAQAPTRTAEGITVRDTPKGTGRISVSTVSQTRRFKYVSYAVLTPDRLVLDLWKSAPPSRAAEVRTGANGCLTLANVRVRPGVVTARGAERNLFEHQLQLVLRGPNGGVLARRALTAAHGHWNGSLRYHAATARTATVEAVDLSAKDGALSCIAEVRANLPVSP